MSTALSVERVAQIRSLHSECESLVRQTFDTAIVIGGLLSEAKAELGHGHWLPWVEANLPFTDRTARNYMRVYQRRDELKSETVSDLTGAYRMLKEPQREPEEEGPAYLPPGGYAVRGHREVAEGVEEVFISPSATDPKYFYVTWMLAFKDGTATVEGLKRPMMRDVIAATVNQLTRKQAHLFE
jgi:hypothetical protein